MYFTRSALEQASSQPVSTYRTKRYKRFSKLLDLGCSVGGDTLALANLAPTTGIDLDPLRLSMAQANLEALGLGEKVSFIQASLMDPLPISYDGASGSQTAIFFDPARRAAGRRAYKVSAYKPPLAIVKDWLRRYPAVGVKVSPGVNLDELRAYDAEVEFISLKGDLKEAVLWFGPLKTTSRRATVLPGPHTLTAPAGMAPDDDADRVLPLSEPLRYLYEPDPAVLRAGLVQALGLQLGAAQLDPDIAYLTADRQVETPFARSWQVEDWLPFGVKRLRAALRERRVGRVTVKKRGSPLAPEELIRMLRLSKEDEGQRVLFLTHLRGRPIVILCLPEN